MSSMSDLARITKRVIGGKCFPSFVNARSRVYESTVEVIQVLDDRSRIMGQASGSDTISNASIHRVSTIIVGLRRRERGLKVSHPSISNKICWRALK
jgi:hypothetical protein